jgi:hypothetical protein
MFLEVIHSQQFIGYIMKYCLKNSDRYPAATVLYKGRKLERNQKLEYFGASDVSSAVECFASISGARRYHTELTIEIINIHLPGTNVIFGATEEE